MIGMEQEDKIIIYHNSKCSKSCAALSELEKTGQEIVRVEYLKNIPSVEDLQGIISKLNCAPHDLIRTTESIYIEKFKGRNLTDDEWLAAMHENPILIQRPIVVKGETAVLARSTDALGKLITL